MKEPEEDPVVTDAEAQITLGLLAAVEENSRVTQRSLASDLGIALGLANAYLKRCVRKGLIKVSEAPANRYAYYLTPHGFSEKSRLTAQYLSASFTFFRRARTQCDELLAQCHTNAWRAVTLAGTGDLAEIAILCAASGKVEIGAIFDPDAAVALFADRPVVTAFDDLRPFDAVLVTDLRNPQAAFDRLAGAVPADRILTPALLNISRTPPNLAV